MSRFGLFLLSASCLGAATTSAQRQAATVLDRLPLRFEANQGQLSSDVRYVAHSGASVLRLTSRGADDSASRVPCWGVCCICFTP